jgi:thiamine transport system permease protein
LLVVVPLAFVAATYGWPLVALVHRSFQGSGIRIVTDTLGNGRLGRIAWQTTAQALVSTLGAVVIGVPAAYCFARYRYPGRRLVWLGVAIPFVLPTIVVSSGFLSLVGSAGLGRGEPGSWTLIVVAHISVNLAVIVRTVAGRLQTIDERIEESARALGRGPIGAALVSISAARDAIVGSSIIVFLFCLTSFGIVAVLGGGSVSTVEIEIWYQTTQLGRLDAGAVLALAQMVLVIGVLLIHLRTLRRRGQARAVTTARRRRPPSPVAWATVAICVAVQLACVAVPVGALVVRSLQVEGGWGLAHYTHLGHALAGTSLDVSPLRAALNSLGVGAIAGAVALVVGAAAAAALARRQAGAAILEVSMMLPLATSAATVGFGILLAYRSAPIDLRGSALAIPLVEATIAMPLVARSLVPVFAALDRHQLDSAATLGAGPRRRLVTIVGPVVRPALALAAGLAFAVSLGEFGATAFLARDDAPTLPQLIFRLLGRPGDAAVGQAMALGVVMVLLTGGVFAALESLGGGRALEF